MKFKFFARIHFHVFTILIYDFTYLSIFCHFFYRGVSIVEQGEQQYVVLKSTSKSHHIQYTTRPPTGIYLQPPKYIQKEG